MRIKITILLLMVLSLSVNAQKENYYLSKTVDLSIEEVTLKVKEVIKKHGFGIVSESDMDQSLKEKLGDVVDMKPYRVLGACNAKIAHKIVSIEENIAIFLPCKVILKYKADNKTEIVVVNPKVAMKAVKNPKAQEIINEVSETFKTILSEI